MTRIQIIDGPNPKTLTLEMDAPLPERLTRVTLMRSHADRVPVVRDLCARAADIVRADIVRVDDTTTRLTLVRKFLPWDAAQVDNARRDLGILLGVHCTLVPPGDLGLPLRAAFDASVHPLYQAVADVFLQAVNPALLKDGGAMELTGLDVDAQSGAMRASVLLLGQCAGCDLSETKTLAFAQDRITELFDHLRAAHPDNADLQRLHFAGFSLANAGDGFVIRL